MKRRSYWSLKQALLLPILLASFACKQTPDKKAEFAYFEYQGKDNRFEVPIDHHREYFNPIIAGFYPDPSICRKGEDYYLVHSSFSFYPGIPIFHSKDLVNWKQLGHVLDRPSQLNLSEIRLSGGIYAPAIEYNPHNDTFYLITTCVDGIGNFIVKTQDPHGSWSDPILLPNVGGIDPSLFFDEDGQAYIVHNDAPAGAPEWEGHRAIWIHHFDTETDQTFGDKKLLVNGGIDPSTKPVWIEGPHIYKINHKYYLMAAEGGTSVNHSEVILTSEHVTGPYTPDLLNPILTQRDLPADREDPVTSVGHADLIETPDGQWYALFLGCRPYEGDLYNTGRETFLLPVTWHNDTPIILDKGLAVPTVVSKAELKPEQNQLTGNFIWRDDFDADQLDQNWSFIRTPEEKWWNLKNGKLQLDAINRNLYQITNPATLCKRQQHLVFEAETELYFHPTSNKEFAGLVCFQNEANNILFGKTIEDGVTKLLVVNRRKGEIARIAEYVLTNTQKDHPLILQVKGNNAYYDFCLKQDTETIMIAQQVDARHLSSNIAGGFVGAHIGLYATSENN